VIPVEGFRLDAEHRAAQTKDGLSPATLVAETTGAVSPVVFASPLRTVVDIALSRFNGIWAAAGHSHWVFPTAHDELLRSTAGEADEVGTQLSHPTEGGA